MDGKHGAQLRRAGRAQRFAILILLVVACSQSTTQVPWPVWPLTLPLSRVDFSCRLPVLDVSRTIAGFNDAFINFPAGSLTPAGAGGLYYDQVVARWLPVGHYGVSPDGRSYAIAKDWSIDPPSPTRVHVIDAATGGDVWVAAMPDHREYGVVDFTSSGVTVIPVGDALEAGVWRLDAGTGALTKISDGYYQAPVGEWIGVVDPRDPNHQFSHATGSPVAKPDRIDRRDGSGTTTWIYEPGYWLDWVTFVGPPLLLVQASRVNSGKGVHDYEYWLVSGPGRLTKLAGYSGQEPTPYRDLEFTFLTGLADEHGVWMSGAASLYLIRRTGVILRVSDHGGVPVNGCD